MGSVGSGVGGNVGGPQQLSVREMETTASTDVAKGLMRIAVDLLDAGLSYVTVNKDDLRYTYTASRPVLAPLVSTRVATSYQDPVDDSQQKAMQENLVNQMPKEFRTLYLAMMELPKEQQSQDFITLNSALQTFARLLILFEASANTIDVESPAANRTGMNVLLPYVALSNSAEQSGVIFTQLQAFLENAGANYPHFDAISGYTNSLATMNEQIHKAIDMLQSPTTENAARALLSDTADQLNALADNFNRLYAGNDLQVFGQTLQSTALIAESLSLRQPGSAPLLIALSLATAGSHSNGGLNLLGDSFTKISDFFSQSLDTMGKGAPAGSSSLTEKLVMSLLTTAFIAGSTAHETTPSFNTNTQDLTPPEVTAERNFNYELVLTMLAKSRILDNISHHALKATDVKGDNLDTAGTVFTSMLSLALVYVSASGHVFTGPVLTSQSQEILQGINTAIATISSGLADGTLDTENLQNFNVYLKQAAIALKNGNEEGFLNAVDSSLELVNTSNDSLSKDAKELKNTSETIGTAFSTTGTELNTGIHVAA